MGAKPWNQLVSEVSALNNADVFLFSQQIVEKEANTLLASVRAVENKRENVVLVLVTDGGDPDAAYQIARCLKRYYKKLILFVFGHCKSAGTLIAVAADEIVMSDIGQFGPLDIQLADKNELLGQTPALDITQSLATLSTTTFDFFLGNFVKLEPGRSLNTKIASEIAIALTLGILEPIARQIDPILIGRVERSMKIAHEYSKRLNPDFKNIKQLVEGYYSHSFVIDYDEAKNLFSSVRKPKPVEEELEKWLSNAQCLPMQSKWNMKLTEDLVKSAANENNNEGKTVKSDPSPIPAAAATEKNGKPLVPAGQLYGGRNQAPRKRVRKRRQNV